MDLTRFEYLLQRYLAQTSTSSENREFKNMLDSGLYEDAVKQDIANALKSRFGTNDEIAEVDEDLLFESIMERVRPVTVRRPIFLNRIWYAAAAVLLGIGISWYFIPQTSDKKVSVAELDSSQAENVVTFANKDFIHLPDGSTVLLNEGSVLTYDSSFGKQYRTVHLRGEAYFDVKKDADHPFIVESGKVRTKVLGTAFNINSNDDKVVVTVTRGLVEVGDNQRVFGKIQPDQQITVNTVKNDFVMHTVKADSSLTWKNENVVLDGISLADASEIIGRKFGVKIAIKNEGIRDCRVSAWFLHGEDLGTILDLVTGTRQATYTLGNNQVTISGGIGCE